MNRMITFVCIVGFLVTHMQVYANECRVAVNQNSGSGNLKNPVPYHKLLLRIKWDQTRTLLSQNNNLSDDELWKKVAKNVINLNEYSMPLLDLIIEKLLFSPRYADNYFNLFTKVDPKLERVFFEKFMAITFNSSDAHLRDVASYVLGQHFVGYEEELLKKITSIITKPYNKNEQEGWENALRLGINVFRYGFTDSYRNRPRLRERNKLVEGFESQYWGLHYLMGDSSLNTNPSHELTLQYVELLKGIIKQSDSYDDSIKELLSTHLVFNLGQKIPEDLVPTVSKYLQFSNEDIPNEVWEPSLNTFIPDRIAAGLALGVKPH